MQEKEIGVVSEIYKDYVILQVASSKNCEGCVSKKYCQSNGKKNRTIKANNSLSLKVGDSVIFENDSALFLKYSLMMYLIPTIALLLGVIGGSYLFAQNGEIFSALLGVALCAIFIFLVRLYCKHETRIPANVVELVQKWFDVKIKQIKLICKIILIL